MNITKPDYNNSILNVINTILKYYNVETKYNIIKTLEDKFNTKPKHVVLILLDGMGVNIINKYLSDDDFLRKHMISSITSVFPSTTVAATNSVLTAKPPLSSGYLGWSQYFTKENKIIAIFPNQDFYNDKFKLSVNYRDKYLKQDLIYDYIEKNNNDVKTYELFPNFVKNGYKSFDLQLNALKTIINKDEKNFTYLYWTQPDELQHETGPYNNRVEEKLKKLNTSLANFSKKINKDTLIITIADHGLAAVEPIKLYKDEELMDMLVRKPSIEPRACNFFIKPNMHNAFIKAFNNKYSKYYKLYSKKEILEEELFGFGVKHKYFDTFLGDFVAVAISSKYFMLKPGKPFIGHHAGLTSDEMLVPLIVYNK